MLPKLTKRGYGLPLADRLWSRIQRTDNPDSCWPWTGSANERGYGYLMYQRKGQRVTRLLWEVTNGTIPPGMHVCHRCDNPSCCNPAHLFLGTHTDNMADKASKGRAPRGEGTKRARLTEDNVREIRAAAALGATNGDLARRFGVSNTAVWHIVLRKTWKHC